VKRTNTRARLAAKRRYAFTVVELLVVLSIIALAAAVLEPVLLGARRSATRTSCQTNLHQMGLAYQLYVSDWDDRYPWSISRFARVCEQCLQDYPPPQSQIPDTVTVLSVYTGGRSGVWRCPADTEPFTMRLTNGAGGTKAQTYPSCFAFAGSSYSFCGPECFGKITTTVRPSAILAEDTLRWHCDVQNPSPFTKTVNAVYADGHVRFVAFLEP